MRSSLSFGVSEWVPNPGCARVTVLQWFIVFCDGYMKLVEEVGWLATSKCHTEEPNALARLSASHEAICQRSLQLKGERRREIRPLLQMPTTNQDTVTNAEFREYHGQCNARRASLIQL